ncbi:MAG: hypothetical protein B7Z08_00025 [Sphingomonadales bacterium 32-68-7]|nr:MAG: hypothetical protein B7Z33_08330 [Sphingomonadales bacterium 12-68-11]OYX10621.1 MAG: hypothetical protein B7Z08_00025 [Sphingomonadales bacterium 32-68-7]
MEDADPLRARSSGAAPPAGAAARRLRLPTGIAWRDLRLLAASAALAAALVGALLWLTLGPPAERLFGTGERSGAIAAPPLEALPARPEAIAQVPVSQLPADQARARNEAIAFADTSPAAASPFRFAGTPLDQARATDCLALAAMAEAGASDQGQRAVIQVVLNRARHPAFPSRICSVVFQGSERSTGCQFTFTCDGSLRRSYGEDAWALARARAQQALEGQVYAPVGTATHYHTDWVHPYWSSQLDKIARVDTHLFFRWRGFWGTRAAARVAYAGGEPAIGALAGLAAHGAAGSAGELLVADAAPQLRHDGGNEVVMRHPNGGAFLVHLGAAASAEAALALGRELCGGSGYCQVQAWTDRAAVPAAYPVPAASRTRLSFSYVRDAGGAEIVFYDCRHFTAVPRERCLPRAAARVS